MFSITVKRSAATLGVVAGLLAAAAAPAAAAPAAGTAGHRKDGLANASETTQGSTMNDGGICDPIRHMGC